MEDALIAIVLIVFSLVSWLFQKGGVFDKSSKGGAQGKDVGDGGDVATEEEERVRKFMEALGMPSGSEPVQAPPPRLEESPPIPPAPAEVETVDPVPVPPPAPASGGRVAEKSFWDADAGDFSWDKESVGRHVEAEEFSYDRAVDRLSRAEREALERVERSGTLQGPKQARGGGIGRAGLPGRLLTSRAGLREAVVVSEILAEPRGLQSLPGPVTIHRS